MGTRKYKQMSKEERYALEVLVSRGESQKGYSLGVK
jgi:hypothetical protein